MTRFKVSANQIKELKYRVVLTTFCGALTLATGCLPEVNQFFSPLPGSTNPGGSTAAPSGGPTTPVVEPSPIVGADDGSDQDYYDPSSPTDPAVDNDNGQDGIVVGGTDDPGKTVCNPFDPNGTSPSGTPSDQGLVARIWYLSDDQPRYEHVKQYQHQGHPESSRFYFPSINVPTRPFSEGFSTQNGDILRRDDGVPLFEYFSIRYESTLRLPAGQPDKKVQFALLADDGAVFRVDNGNGEYKKIVRNDGNHQTKFACAKKAVTLSSASATPIRLDYYQGPRYHIAVVLMMREWTAAQDSGDNGGDAACGTSGNDLFFDSTTTPSTPKQAYVDLLNRGWQVVPAGYYHLKPPALNPCN